MRKTAFSCCLVLSLLVAGCSDDSGGSPDGSPDTGTPDAGPDTSVDAGPEKLIWTSCGAGRVECATMTVPVDHGDPAGGTMKISLLRWPALSPAERIGVLVYHPGGPGLPGVEAARALPGQLVPAAGEVVRRFDIIGVDVRGTGSSSPSIDCFADAEAISRDLDQAQDDAAVDAVITAALAACRSKVGADVLPHLDTVSAARDVDRLRELLGEQTISILGGSYGTWFAAVYATLYPDRVRAAVLPSALPASNDVFDRVETQIRGTEAALSAFFSWCDGSASCAFKPASGTTQEAFDALAAAIIASPLESTTGLGKLYWGMFGSAVQQALYSPKYSALAASLEAAEGGDPDPLIKAFTAQLDSMKGWYDDVFVIHALDDTVKSGATVDDWRTRLTAIRAAAPSFGALIDDRYIRVRAALLWTDRPAEPFAVEAIPSAPPFLVLSADHDPVTPVEGAETLVSALGNGSVMLDTQNVGHSSLSGPCALSRSQEYLLDPASLAGSPPNVACPEPAPDETVIGTASAVFPWDLKNQRTAETELGDLVADAMRAAAGTQIAVVNGGGIRTALPSPKVLPANKTLRRPEAGYAPGPPYDVIVDDVRKMLPYGNRIVTATVSGAELRALLEHAVSTYDGAKGKIEFLQISGVRMTFKASAAAGSRITSLTLDDNTAVTDGASYTLALPDYVWYGGTGFLELVKAASGPPALGDSLEDAAADYFRENSLTPGTDLIPATDGRITIEP